MDPTNEPGPPLPAHAPQGPVPDPRVPTPPPPAGPIASGRIPPGAVVLQVRVRTPWVTWVLVGINVLVYAVGLWSGRATQDWIIERFGQDRGAVWAGEYWRLVTATFLHAGFAHLLFNMVGLALLGKLLERLLGHIRFLFLYALAGVSGALFFQVFSDGPLGLGASGAIYGIFGAFLALRSALHRGGPYRPLRSFLFWTVFVFAFDQVFAMIVEASARVGIASSAHAGGFVAGATLGFTGLGRVLPVRRRWIPLRRAARVALFILLAGLGVHAARTRPAGAELGTVELVRQVDGLLEKGDAGGAVQVWRQFHFRRSKPYRTAGYLLFENMAAAGQADLAREVLDELLALATQAIKQAAAAGHIPAELLNEAAWYHALRNDRLAEGAMLANQAVNAASSEIPGRPWRWFLSMEPYRERLGMILNTRGWIAFLRWKRRAEPDLLRQALGDLEEAVELSPVGGNYVFLALARYHGQGDLRGARLAIEKAREIGGLSPYEEVLLEDLRETMGDL